MGVDKRRVGIVGLFLSLILFGVVSRYWEYAIDSISPLEPPPPPLAVNTTPQPEIVEDTIQKNRSLVATLVDYEVPVAIANEVAGLIKPIFDVRKLRFGN